MQVRHEKRESRSDRGLVEGSDSTHFLHLDLVIFLKVFRTGSLLHNRRIKIKRIVRLRAG